jgi:phosphoglycolate phosphatase-like HAD superfamily hydrolase
MRRAAIFDMDGTLVNVSSVRHWVTPVPPERSRRFDRFHEDAVNCPPHEWVCRAARDVFNQGVDILVVTARSARYRNSTAFWLAMHDVPSHALFMRADGDHRKDYLVKADILRQIRASGWQPVVAFDDNPHVIRLWEENGIPTVVVPGWEE